MGSDSQCGGPNGLGRGWRNSVYAVQRTPTWYYIGCYVDDRHRDLKQGPMKFGYDQDRCFKACINYRYFALQAGGWCACGNAYSTSPRYRKVSDSQCGGASKKGAGGRNSVYGIRSLTPRPTKSSTNLPTFLPSSSPTDSPTNLPTSMPSFSPTGSPTNVPTSLPSFSPTDSPTNLPTSRKTKRERKKERKERRKKRRKRRKGRKQRKGRKRRRRGRKSGKRKGVKLN